MNKQLISKQRTTSNTDDIVAFVFLTSLTVTSYSGNESSAIFFNTAILATTRLHFMQSCPWHLIQSIRETPLDGFHLRPLEAGRVCEKRVWLANGCGAVIRM